MILKNNGLSGHILNGVGKSVNLIKLDLRENQLKRKIPLEIGNLINLNILQLRNNYFIGVIPMSICDLNILWTENNFFDINENQFCPPYPSCIEDYVGEQYTSDCD